MKFIIGYFQVSSIIGFAIFLNLCFAACVYSREVSSLTFVQLINTTKSSAMGYATSAYQGKDGFYENPASISSVGQTLFQTQYLSYLEDVSLKDFMVIFPSSIVNVGLSYSLLDYGSYPITTTSDRSGIGSGSISNQGILTKLVIAKKKARFGFGISVSNAEERLVSYKANQLFASVGVNYSFGETLGVGLSVNGISLNENKFLNQKLTLLKTNKLGLSYRPKTFKQQFLFTLDAIQVNGKYVYFGYGGDISIHDFLSFQFGYQNRSDLFEFSFGLGLYLGSLSFDFCYKPVELFNDTYQISIGLNF